mgnify:FL=1|jgi:hypothetical protein|tara:strand:+ start:741 stop:875 length:135 start_codon:yes stop_codon:yes gene_type:complete
MTIKNAFTQQYNKKISLLSQQTGKYGKKKIKSRKTTTRKNSKKY